MKIDVKLAQLNLTSDLDTNKDKVTSMLEEANEGDWVLFPECTLTGYFPEDEGFLEGASPEVIDAAVNEIAELAKERQCYCLLGTARYSEGAWYNSVALISPSGVEDYYDKVGVSELDKRHFTAGNEIRTYEMGGVRFGVQICRDLVLPAQWQELKEQGADIVFHSDNAIKPYDDVWEHLLIARAVENQIFVASANNCAEPAELTSYIVAPSGEQVTKASRQQEGLWGATVDLINYTSPY